MISHAKECTIVHGKDIVHGDLAGVGVISGCNIWLNAIIVDRPIFCLMTLGMFALQTSVYR
jgi:hypothetical protein